MGNLYRIRDSEDYIETFQLTEEEKSQLLDFRDAVRQLLLETQRQTKAKLISIYI